jgi:hypothetical protein
MMVLVWALKLHQGCGGLGAMTPPGGRIMAENVTVAISTAATIIPFSVNDALPSSSGYL